MKQPANNNPNWHKNSKSIKKKEKRQKKETKSNTKTNKTTINTNKTYLDTGTHTYIYQILESNTIVKRCFCTTVCVITINIVIYHASIITIIKL